ncbi:PREDICTED: fibroblast growth factor receptor 2-like isoform X1 [Amphimedon queenslandica]|uniref:Protein kinase domain-containing protein n=2 Tax=Amphimedon queenslandica TaxID=400682 RepID=A0AAN0JNU0_AMPQE|nr:PREDICTED: fibroblast growth factor receptor 2-like isoform X1 [Amphimedon queenslandica]|eukprot:XP_019858476.1 PREDICTED: fibroblast growth factor receptor 2-like isoform X1 [Amphimedon queenslandica]
MLLLSLFLCWILAVAYGCVEGDVQLVDGDVPNVGRVEICINNEWGTVCDDGWTHTNAEVVCRQLGYPTYGAAYLNRAFFGPGAGPIHLDEVVCTGSEETILNCSHSGIGINDCNHDADVSVHCQESVPNEESVPNMTVCSTDFNEQRLTALNANGRCEPYYQRDSPALCDSVYNSDLHYVYIPKTRFRGSQYLLRQFAEEVVGFIPTIPESCRGIAVGVLCTHYYLPCGFNDSLHLPLPICPNVCQYMSEVLCPDIWLFTINYLASDQIESQYRNDPGIVLPTCDNTDNLINFLNLTSDCCSNGGITVPQPTTTTIQSNEVTASTSSATTLHSTNATAIETSLSPSSSIDIITSSSRVRRSSNRLAIIIPVVVVTLIIAVQIKIIIIFVYCLIKKRRNKAQSMRPVTNGATRSMPIDSDNLQEDNQHVEISSHYIDQLSSHLISGLNLTIQESVGQGEFGIVYRGLISVKNDIPQAIAAKTLKGFYSKSDIDSLLEECIIMMSFDNLNVLPLIGVCLDLGPAPYIIMPFMSRGSLLSYLKKERPNLTVADTSEEDIVLNVRKQLLSICLQVANGMCYLASQRFIHRDLAARNCMIDDNGIIKVADFGLSEDIYAKNYFRQFKRNSNDSPSLTTVKLPVKWMAIESLHDGLFSKKTDVWSYGILCWEVFSLGRAPYPGLDPVGVVEFLDTGGRLLAPRGEACSKEIYSLMTSCWSESPDDRPVFSDLVSSINALIEPLAGYLDFNGISNNFNNSIEDNDSVQ